MKTPSFHSKTSNPCSDGQGIDGPNVPHIDNDFLADGISPPLIAHTNIDPFGLVIAHDGSLVHSFTNGLAIKAGERVIVVQIIESVGWEVELYLSEDEWEKVDVI